jgi:hypothetical protein
MLFVVSFQSCRPLSTAHVSLISSHAAHMQHGGEPFFGAPFAPSAMLSVVSFRAALYLYGPRPSPLLSCCPCSTEVSPTSTLPLIAFPAMPSIRGVLSIVSPSIYGPRKKQYLSLVESKGKRGWRGRCDPGSQILGHTLPVMSSSCPMAAAPIKDVVWLSTTSRHNRARAKCSETHRDAIFILQSS